MVASLTPWRLATSATLSLSASRRIRTICSSLYRVFFICLSLSERPLSQVTLDRKSRDRSLPQRHDRGGSIPCSAPGQSALPEAVAAARSRGSQEPGTTEPDAPSSLEAECSSKGEAASVPGPVAGPSSVVLRQTAAQRVLGDEELKTETS